MGRLALAAVLLANASLRVIDAGDLNEHFDYSGYILIVHVHRAAVWTPAGRLFVNRLPPAPPILLFSLFYLFVWSVLRLTAGIRLRGHREPAQPRGFRWIWRDGAGRAASVANKLAAPMPLTRELGLKTTDNGLRYK